MYNIYNTVKPKRIVYNVSTNNRTVQRSKAPVDYRSMQYFKDDYNDEYFIKLYCKMRFLEEEIKYTKEEQDKIINDVQGIAKSVSKTKAIRNFERFINNTLDYSGNLQYYIDKRRSIETGNETGQTTTLAPASSGATTGY